VAPKVEIDRIETWGTRGLRYRPVTPDPLPREIIIQVLACYAAEMLIRAFLGFLHSSGYLETCSFWTHVDGKFLLKWGWGIHRKSL
jgi:hypothetical protein